MNKTKIEVVKQWLKNKKEFTPLEVIETLQKENAELKAQIEKLKECHNCKYSSCSGSIEPCKYCKFCWYSEKKEDKWEIAD